MYGTSSYREGGGGHNAVQLLRKTAAQSQFTFAAAGARLESSHYAIDSPGKEIWGIYMKVCFGYSRIALQLTHLSLHTHLSLPFFLDGLETY